jgi:hypothetical protein
MEALKSNIIDIIETTFGMDSIVGMAADLARGDAKPDAARLGRLIRFCFNCGHNCAAQLKLMHRMIRPAS